MKKFYRSILYIFGAVGKIRKILLLPLAGMYHAGIFLRNQLYQFHILKEFEFDVPILAVGNLSVGGTGKTPHVEYLIELLKDHHNIATLSRGYRRRSSGFIMANDKSDARQIGDEPMQYHYKYPDITVAVGEERALAIPQILSEKPGTEAIILDDAFQHIAVKAGFYILLTKYNELFTEDHILPAGMLREPRAAAARADVVVVTKCPDDIADQKMIEINKKIVAYTSAPVYFSSIKYLQPYNIFNPQEKIDLDKYQQILLVSAIASVGSLTEFLNEKNIEVSHLEWADHHYFTDKDLEKIRASYKSMNAAETIILTTEKDAMRLLLHKEKLQIGNLKIFALPIKIKMLQNSDGFNQSIINFIRNFNSTEHG